MLLLSTLNKHAPSTLNDTTIATISGVKTPPPNVEPKRDEWRSERDLEAQWQMAQWAAISAIAALIGLVITGVGIIFVRQTLDATRAAVAESARAAEATHKAVQGDRAWMSLAGLLALPVGDKDRIEDRIGFLFQVTWKNTGRSPAIDCEILCGLSIVDGKAGPEAPLFDHSSMGKRAFAHVPVGPGIESKSTTPPVNFATLRELFDNKKRIVIYSRVQYFDVFSSQMRHTEATFDVIDQRPFSALREVPFRSETFFYSSTGRQNTAS
jgi:hypothetical protein